jgi:hypothetical protein
MLTGNFRRRSILRCGPDDDRPSRRTALALNARALVGVMDQRSRSEPSGGWGQDDLGSVLFAMSCSFDDDCRVLVGADMASALSGNRPVRTERGRVTRSLTAFHLAV